MRTQDFNEQISEPAIVETFGDGGGIAKKLLANNMNPSALRTNATLTYDAWKKIDDKVLMVYQERLRGIADLQAAGLTYQTDGLGQTMLQYQDESDVTDAEMNMDGVNKTNRDRLEYDNNFLPLPIISKDFSFSAREIAASRKNGGNGLDTRMMEKATRKVAEKAEEILFQGASAYSFGSSTENGIIRGYQDHPSRSTASVTAPWASTTGENILTDTIAMKNAAIASRKYGPFNMYVAANVEGNLDQNYVAGYPTTIRQRILQVDNIQSVKVIDKMTAGGVLLVSMQSDVVRLVEGLPIQVVEWETDGGMMLHFKVMTILVPQIFADQTGRSGIVHYS
ncbi:MAG: bacteriocin family protein [Gammaproteobacteria bacterium]|nr:bacteriocin family protein [Gammaproteobacteria bacterium]